MVQGSLIGNNRMWELSDVGPFHSHTYWQVFVESFIPTKLLTGLCHILLSSWSSQQKWLCKVNIPNQLQNLNNFCYMRGKWLARYAFQWYLWLPRYLLCCYATSGYRPNLIQRINTKASLIRPGLYSFAAPPLISPNDCIFSYFLLTVRVRRVIWDSRFPSTEGILGPISLSGGPPSLTGLFLWRVIRLPFSEGVGHFDGQLQLVENSSTYWMDIYLPVTFIDMIFEESLFFLGFCH